MSNRKGGLMVEQRQEERDETIQHFHEAVNMTGSQLEMFLATKASKTAGRTRNGTQESLDHQSGRHIVTILHKKPADYTEDDLTQMKRTVSYVTRHATQPGPAKNKEHSAWRYSLMNWGCDPLRKG